MKIEESERMGWKSGSAVTSWRDLKNTREREEEEEAREVVMSRCGRSSSTREKKAENAGWPDPEGVECNLWSFSGRSLCLFSLFGSLCSVLSVRFSARVSSLFADVRAVSILRSSPMTNQRRNG